MSGRKQWLWEVYVLSHVGGYGRFRSSALSVLLELRFFFARGCIIESTENPSAIQMQSSLIQEEIGWSGYLYLSKCLLMWQTERERGRGKGTDGGSERVEEIGETDHLRSVGRQHKPVGEGRSLLDSVLQRDRRRDRGEGVWGVRIKTQRQREDREWSREMQQREKASDGESFKNKAGIGLAVENHQGVRSHRELEKFGLSFLSYLKCLFTPDVCIKY